MNCRSCKGRTTKFFSLGQMPLVNSFLTEKQIEKPEKTYELALMYCHECHLVQLTKTVPPEDMFVDYIYFSSVSQTILDHAKKSVEQLSKRFKLNEKSSVLEIASNDGYMLQFFKEKGIKVLGVDPAKNVAEVAIKKGIETEIDFFSYKKARELKAKGVAPSLIFGANVLAHVPTIHDFAKGIQTILPKSGVAIFEFPYGHGLFEGKFDTIYHEHVFYYTLIAVKNVFATVGMNLYDVEIVPMQGGSLRIYIKHEDVANETTRLKKLLAKEKKLGYDSFNTYEKLGIKIEGVKTKLLKTLDQIKSKGKSIAAYSAPAKGIILLNYFGIKSNYIDFIVDKAKEKQGLYVPGIHMKVYPPEKVLNDQPDYLIILCWNISQEVMIQLDDYHKNGGKFIIPIPKVKVI